MVETLQIILAVLVICTAGLSAYFSFKARREADGKVRGLMSAKLNINMGLMLIFIAILLMLLFSGSSVRVVVCALFMLLGLFNLFAGMRNRTYFTRLIEHRQPR